jgi:hypothetical protein
MTALTVATTLTLCVCVVGCVCVPAHTRVCARAQNKHVLKKRSLFWQMLVLYSVTRIVYWRLLFPDPDMTIFTISDFK